MTQARVDAGLVRVTVAADGRRADLALPGSVPVAELLPELARSVGVLDAAAVHAGYRLVAPDGRVLDGDSGLTWQGIEDGAVLSLAAGVEDEPPRVYDDIVEAMADAVEREVRPWEPASGRRTALGSAVVLLSLGAFALGLLRVSLAAAAAAAVVAVLLLAAATVLARLRDEPEVAPVLCWTAAGYAAVAGLVGVEGTLLGLPLAVAGAVVALTGLAGMAALVEHRNALLPAVVVGAVAAVAGGLAEATGFSPAQVAAVAVVVLVVAGALVPRLALGTTRTRVDQPHSHTDLTLEPAPVDPAQVHRDVRAGHESLLATTVSVGAVLVLAAPLLVTLGITGALVAVVAAGVLLLRTRQYRSAREVSAGLLSGLAALASVVVAAIALQPDWRPVLSVVLAVAAALLLLLTLVPRTPSVRQGRLGDVAEGVALVALLPLLVVAIGLLDAVRG